MRYSTYKHLSIHFIEKLYSGLTVKPQLTLVASLSTVDADFFRKSQLLII